MEGSPWVRVALPSSVAEPRARIVAALHGLARVRRAGLVHREGEEDEQIDEAIGDISGESCASLLGLFEGPPLREACE